MDISYIVGGIVIVALVGLTVFLAAGVSKKTLPVVAKNLMTKRERKAIIALEEIFPDCRVHSQVAMAAVLTTKSGLDKKTRASMRNRFDRKIVDFVIESRDSGEIVLLVELDDKTHNADRDAARDAITSAAGYQTVRIPPQMRLDPVTFARLFSPQLSQAA